LKVAWAPFFMRTTKQEFIEIEGSLGAILYENGDFGVARFRLQKAMPDIPASAMIVGRIPLGRKGYFRLTGKWTMHPDYGRRFEVEYWEPFYRMTTKGLEKFLKDNFFGIGSRTAQRLVEKFGLKLETVIQKDPEKITEVLGEKRGQRFLTEWNAGMGCRELRKFLANHGMSPVWASRIWERWAERSIETLQKDPYRLTEIRGIGFEGADQLAMAMDWPRQSPERSRGILFHLLREARQESHTCLPRAKLVKRAVDDCQVDAAVMEEVLDKLISQGRLREEVVPTQAGQVSYIYLRRMYEAEVSVVASCMLLLGASSRPLGEEFDNELAKAEKELGIEATHLQRRAVRWALEKPISILTGGPGTGKSETVRLIVKLAKKLNRRLELCAPTGRAAKHIEDITGYEARTIHRLLRYNPASNEWQVNAENPLEADLVVVDEASMVDIELAERLFDAIPVGCHVLLIGDTDQLPAVGAGRVLDDMIRSRRIPVTRLDKIFRQAESSSIVVNAHRIIRGEEVRLPCEEEEDMDSSVDAFLVKVPKKSNFSSKDEADAAVEQKIVKLVRDELPERYGFDPFEDIQVLVPMKKGPCGVQLLNLALQKALNPSKQGYKVGSTEYRCGDRVMVHRNTYDLDVFNGDIGTIQKISPESKAFLIDFYGHKVVFPFKMADRLSLAYCSTIHKSQGSEYPAVVLVVLGRHHVMLQRNLLYTGITRAKKLLVVVSEPWILNRCVENVKVKDRITFLRQRLEKFPKKETDE